jgi:hypothetical protein
VRENKQQRAERIQRTSDNNTKIFPQKNSYLTHLRTAFLRLVYHISARKSTANLEFEGEEMEMKHSLREYEAEALRLL